MSEKRMERLARGPKSAANSKAEKKFKAKKYSAQEQQPAQGSGARTGRKAASGVQSVQGSGARTGRKAASGVQSMQGSGAKMGRKAASGVQSKAQSGFHTGKEPKRVVSRCKYFDECGGCQMIDIPYEEQLLLKERETRKLLKPFVKLEGIIGMEEPEHYRNKVSAAFTHDKKGVPLSGVYKEGTHYIVPVEKCLLENQKADEIIGSIRSLLPSFKIKTYDEDTGYGFAFKE